VHLSFTGPDGALQVFGITLIGATPENATKLLLTLALIAGAVAFSRALRWRLTHTVHASGWPRLAFWLRQGLAIVLALSVIVVTVSIWFDDPERLTTAVGLVSAGLAFAMQRVVTAVAGYIVISRGTTFNVGDRITMSSRSTSRRRPSWKWVRPNRAATPIPTCGCAAGTIPAVS
jgi:small-conductance mechanosensitive channel